MRHRPFPYIGLQKTDVHTYAYENTNLRPKTLPELPSEPP